MRRSILLFACGCLLCLHLSCASGSRTLNDPVGNGVLLIGGVIFENNGYQNFFESTRKNIEVALIGQYDRTGKREIFGQWVRTDEEGYFFVANAPPGEYAIKAVRVYVGGQFAVTISNELLTMVDNYKIQPSEFLVFSGRVFEHRPEYRVVDFGYHGFSLQAQGDIVHANYREIKELRLVDGSLLTLPPVKDYFSGRFPESIWGQYWD